MPIRCFRCSRRAVSIFRTRHGVVVRTAASVGTDDKHPRTTAPCAALCPSLPFVPSNDEYCTTSHVASEYKPTDFGCDPRGIYGVHRVGIQAKPRPLNSRGDWAVYLASRRRSGLDRPNIPLRRRVWLGDRRHMARSSLRMLAHATRQSSRRRNALRQGGYWNDSGSTDWPNRYPCYR